MATKKSSLGIRVVEGSILCPKPIQTIASWQSLREFPHFSKNVNYAYNTVGALGAIGTDLIGSNPNATNFVSLATFHATRALNVLTYGNGRQLTMGYALQRSQPTSMKVDKVSDSTNKVLDYSYDYQVPGTGENNNRIRKITDNLDPAYTMAYTYGGYNRLKDANLDGRRAVLPVR